MTTPHWPIPEALRARLPAKGKVDAHPQPGTCKLTLDASGGAVEVLEQCAQLHEKDKKAERYASIAGWVAFIGLFGALAAVIVSEPVVAGVVGVICIIGLIASRMSAGGNLEDRRLELLSGVLTTFAAELHDGRHVEAAVDFSNHDEAPNDRGDVYRHQWLTLRLPFKDGTLIRLAVTTQVKRKTRRKRKYTKIKDKVTDQLTVQLVAPKGREFPSGMKLPSGRVAGLTLVRSAIKPRSAALSYRADTMLRVCGRHGWTFTGTQSLLYSHGVVTALIHSYKLIASAQHRMQAS